MGVAGGAIAPPDFNLVGQPILYAPPDFKQNCQLIVNLLTINVNLIKLAIEKSKQNCILL